MDELTDEEVHAQGLEDFLAFRTEVAAVQMHLHDGPWEVDLYGVGPDAAQCDRGVSGYTFHMVRAVRGLDYDAGSAPEELIDWLRERGWRNAGLTGQVTSDDGTRARGGRASFSPDGNVITLLFTFAEATQSVSLHATSTCYPGDQWRLYNLIYPDLSASVKPLFPEFEHPNDPPVFRFSLEDGNAIDEWAEEYRKLEEEKAGQGGERQPEGEG